jgi:hypothetical protein
MDTGMRTAVVGRHYGITDQRFVSPRKMKTASEETLTPVLKLVQKLIVFSP